MDFLKKYQTPPIGKEFLPLRPAVQGIDHAGYISCRGSSHPLTDTTIMGPYQQSQFALAPLIVDYDHPLNHRYIILECPDEEIQEAIRRKLSARIIVKTPDGIALLNRE